MALSVVDRWMVGSPPKSSSSSNYFEDDSSFQGTFVYCCVPRGCDRYREDRINVDQPNDCVKVSCNNASCTESGWMHADCFKEWELQVLSFLRSCARARSWTEKQRMQNLWTPKGYGLVFRACDCKCGRGHLKRDLDYNPQAERSNKKQKPKSAKSGMKPVLIPSRAVMGSSINYSAPTSSHLDHYRPSRIRTNSLSSTGSSGSPPSSAGTPPETPNSFFSKKRFDFFQDANQAAAGNIFKRRTDYSVFKGLPRNMQNPYHIKMEDEGELQGTLNINSTTCTHVVKITPYIYVHPILRCRVFFIFV